MPKAGRYTVFGRWLKREVERRGMNMAGFAGLVGVSQASVSDWVRGKTTPSEENRLKIARVLRVPATEVYEALEITRPVDDEGPEYLQRLMARVRQMSPEQAERFERLIDALLDVTEPHPGGTSGGQGAPGA
jgi:transcriptional regulator with XRE-family HTH domain